ncbi:hypothetical protein [Shewanella fidelis]|uniref:Uncharacterized protein n=1 Tax=Shewanella fidelis TaxID=173509 RepID=A0AAW8NPW3_9GAMM|nr:hypothetical protein [Shewanella fidelis]MDR8523849.1 hypothetical protein [Shewanella fidelis]MDW4810397.1 hypothetical protein [Shewanella fidelis]MDW4823716.1 hypothetical protein [Shewanella fidelis]
MAGEALAHIDCTACGTEKAAIKKIGNSSLLYTHCKKCGCDRRSGAAIQAIWQAAIDGGSLEPDVSNPATDIEDPKQNGDWVPPQENEQETENSEPAPSMAKAIFSAALLGLGCIGLVIKAAR